MILVFDVGNTETTIGLFDDETLRGHWRIVSGVPRTSDEFGVLLRGLRKRCPRCGAYLSQISPNDRVTTWCRTCQT